MKFEVPQRQQLASERTSLTLFAPAPSTISFVPLTRNLSLADPSPYPVRVWTGLSDATATRFPVLRTTKCDAFSEAHRTKNRLLRYGRDIRYQKQLPVVRDASSEAFGVKNRLFWYGRDIRYRKQPPVVRDAFSETFGDKKELMGHAKRFQRPAEQPTPQTVDSLLSHRTHFQRRAVPKAAPAHRTQLQCAKEPPLSLFTPAAPSLAPSTALGTGNSPPLGGEQI